MITFPVHILNEHAPKPVYGEPCNNCGLCCRVEACRVSVAVFQSHQTPCIALEFHDDKFLCGLALNPEKYLNMSHLGQGAKERVKEMLRSDLLIGQGCTMDDPVLVALAVEPEDEVA